MIPSIEQIPEWLEKSLLSPVAVLGGGASGRAACSLIERLGGKAVLYDQSENSGSAAEFDPEAAESVSLVVYSPGFSQEHPWLKLARQAAGRRVIPEFDLGAALWKGPIIAVTGTNGKTTLVSFINEALRQAGIESYALGNIGEPICAALSRESNPEAVAVCEISSFQSERMDELRADHVLWTNFDEDHLDRHASMEAYFRSKYRLVENARGNSLIAGASVRKYARLYGLDIPESCVVAEEGDPDALGIRGSVFESKPEIASYLMARELWKALNLNEEDLILSARGFVKPPHRMEYVDTVAGVEYWNDSKATNFHAALGGLARFDQPVVWIGGGKGKGGDVRGFARKLAAKIKAAELIGETRQVLGDVLEEEGIPVGRSESLEAAVEAASQKANPGDCVAFSPGFASFDMFNGYGERGEFFRKAVDCLKRKES